MYDLDGKSWQQGIGMSKVSMSPDSPVMELKGVSKKDFAVSQECLSSIEQSARTGQFKVLR